MPGERGEPRVFRTEFPALPVALGPVVVDWGRLVVVRDGAETKVTPKAAEVLQLLLAHPDETVPRARILEAAWPGSYSSDEVLTQVIAELRRVLGDNAREPALIATVPKLGYRWVGPAPVTVARTSGAPPTVEPEPRARSRAPWIALVVALVGLASWFALRGPAREAPRSAAPAAAIPVTVEPGLDLDPDLDADGRRVAYVHGDGSGVELRVRDLGGTAFQALDIGPVGTPSGPAWSPDGRSLAFVWRTADRCEIRKLELEGGPARTLATGCPVSIPTSATWTPSGDAVLFSRAAAGESGSMERRHVAIHRVPAGGGEVVAVSTAPRRLLADVHPCVSPDGTRVAFVRDGDARNRVLVQPLAGGDPVDVPLPVWPYRVEWNGAESLLVAGHGRTPSEIWRVPLDGSQPAQLAGPAAGPGMSVAGGTLVHEQRTIDDNLWSVPYGAAGSPVRFTDQTRSELAPRVSRDGRSLAWLSDQSGSIEVHVRDINGGGERRLSTFAPESALDLQWSPDGRHLAVVVGTLKGKRVAVLALDGARVPMSDTVSSLHVAQAAFSGDGQYLVLAVEDEGRRELRRVPFPALDADEPMLDAVIASFAPVADSADLWIIRPGVGRLERHVAATGTLEPHPDIVDAAPADQWTVGDGRLLVMHQVERSTDARLQLFELGTPAAVATWAISAPQPPLGRNVELGAGRVWFAQRDLDEVDLVAQPLR